MASAPLCRIQDLWDAQIRLRSRGRPDVISLVRPADVQGRPVYVGIDRDGGDPQFAASADHTYCDLSAIGDENFLEHGLQRTGFGRTRRFATEPVILPEGWNGRSASNR